MTRSGLAPGSQVRQTNQKANRCVPSDLERGRWSVNARNIDGALTRHFSVGGARFLSTLEVCKQSFYFTERANSPVVSVAVLGPSLPEPGSQAESRGL